MPGHRTFVRGERDLRKKKEGNRNDLERVLKFRLFLEEALQRRSI